MVEARRGSDGIGSQLITVCASSTNMYYDSVLDCVAYFVLLVTVFGSASITTRTDLSVGDRCTTPLEDAGECRNVNNCSLLLEYMRQSKAPNISLLKDSVCGFDGLESLVCCPVQSSRRTVLEETQERNRSRISTTTQRSSTSVTSAQCGKNNLHVDRIVGGDTVNLGDWPWIAALGYRSRTSSGIKWLCGGALVTSRHVITAAHCVVIPADKTLSVVRLGDINLEDGVADGASPVDVDVDRAIPYPSYRNSAKVDDIAIVRLTREVQFNDNIQAICLPSISRLRSGSLVGQTSHVAGWGALIFRGPLSKELQQVDVNITDEDSCRNAYRNQRGAVIDNRVICAGKPGKDACQGDSGGPLMLDQGATYYLVGVVSYGKNCAEPGYPGVYTRVSSFMDWINSNLN